MDINLFQESYENKYYEIKDFEVFGDMEYENDLKISGSIIYPKYNLTSSPLPFYVLIQNNYEDVRIDSFYLWFKPESIDGSEKNNFISPFLFNDTNNRSYNEILIENIKPKSEEIRKLWISNQFSDKTIIEFSNEYTVTKNGIKYSPEIDKDDLIGSYLIEFDNVKALKSIVLPYFLLPPFSNAVIPFIILFIGFILESYIIDKQKTSIIYKNNAQNKKTLDLNIYNDFSDELGVFLISIGKIYFWIKIIKNLIKRNVMSIFG